MSLNLAGGRTVSESKACANGKQVGRADFGKHCEGRAEVLAMEMPWGSSDNTVGTAEAFGPTGGLSAVLGAHLLAAQGAELGSSCSRFLGSQKNCSFRGSSFTSTGIASYSSLSMLKEPPVPCEEESVQLTPHLAESC